MKFVSTVHASEAIEKECVPPGSDNCAAVIRGFEDIFANILSAVLGLAGIVLFIMLIVGGFKYITSGGDPKAAAAARMTLTHAIMGLVLVASSYLILRLIGIFIGNEMGLTTFRVWQP